MTKKEMFGAIATAIEKTTVENKAEMLAFIEKQVAQLDKKSSKSSPTKNQLANETYKVEMLECLVDIGKPVTVTEFMALTRFNLENEFSNQKVSALFRQLVDANLVKRETIKKKSYFSVV